MYSNYKLWAWGLHLSKRKMITFSKDKYQKEPSFWDSQKDASIFERKLAIYLLIYHLFQVLLKYHF